MQLARNCSKEKQRKRGLKYNVTAMVLLREKGSISQHQAEAREDAHCSLPILTL